MFCGLKGEIFPGVLVHPLCVLTTPGSWNVTKTIRSPLNLGFRVSVLLKYQFLPCWNSRGAKVRNGPNLSVTPELVSESPAFKYSFWLVDSGASPEWREKVRNDKLTVTLNLIQSLLLLNTVLTCRFRICQPVLWHGAGMTNYPSPWTCFRVSHF